MKKKKVHTKKRKGNYFFFFGFFKEERERERDSILVSYFLVTSLFLQKKEMKKGPFISTQKQ